ncbi:hypothetical protein M5K25_010914 [Dendrobium thyrsiflorum]|uniref:Uncharacterized protein n=1 Tax=Dendrobium thyrsiflorum TaxID=117978 RepID=A0ABD0V1I2_DENTH
MADSERDFGMVYDEQCYVQILHSTFFDVDPDTDHTIEGYVARILDTLVDAIEEQLGVVQWRDDLFAKDRAPRYCYCLVNVGLSLLSMWLLGYPVIYLFRKEHAADAVYNLSTKFLHIFKIVICRRQTPSRKSHEEELLSFSVPYELSCNRDKELWAKAFFAHLLAKFETCKQVWSSIRLEVTECFPQAIVL